MNTRNVKRNLKKNTKETIQKSRNWKLKKIWTVLWLEKVIILQFTKKLTLYRCRQSKEEIENGELERTDGIGNMFLRGFGLLKEQTDELGKKIWHKKRGKTFNFEEIWIIYLKYKQQKILDWLKN